MIAAIAAAALVVVVLIAAWSRRAASRADRRSVRTYGKVLGVLGDVSSRSETHVARPHAEADEVAPTHVHQSEEGQRPAPRRRDGVPAARVRLEPPVPPGGSHEPQTTVVPSVEQSRGSVPLSEQAKLVARQRAINASAPQEVAAAPVVRVPRVPRVDPQEPPGRAAPATAPRASSRTVPDQDETPTDSGADEPAKEPAAGAPVGPDEERPILFDDEAEATTPPRRPARDVRRLAPGRSETMRRAATAAAVVVVVGALAVGGYELATSHSRGTPGATSPTTATTAPAKKASAPPAHPRASSTTTAPTRLEPSAQSGSLVTYKVPTSSYTLSLSAAAAGACWVGVQPAGSSKYLWMDTLAPGATTSYKATGAIVLRIGNPRVLSAAVDGVKVVLPTGRTIVYDVSFVPSSGT